MYRNCIVISRTCNPTRLNALKKFSHLYSTNSGEQRNVQKLWLFAGASVAAALGYYGFQKLKISNRILALQQRRDEIAEKAVKLTAREKRFIKFASVEYDGQIYCTPQDFLESVVEQEPRPRLKRKVLNNQEINQLKDYTPDLKHGSVLLFRSLRDKGIISFTEYLFLLSVLTKPQSGFRIAFNMFDADGNQRVDKDEFLVIRKLLGGSMKGREIDDDSREVLLKLLSTSAQAKYLLRAHRVAELGEKDDKIIEEKKKGFMEKIFSFAWRGKRGLEGEGNENDNMVDDEQGLQRRHKVDTTLQIHFFGKKGSKELEFDGFNKFMNNLQTEVLELEFNEFSKGAPKISEVDFAKILLRYTYLDTDEYDNYLDRLLDRETKEKGVTFDEFRQFCQFLNNLEDFSIAMRMYTLADRPISKDEFGRAVKICTGSALSEHLIETVFAIFDEDGDGLLSYKEFIAIMRDRLHRGFKVSKYKVIDNENLNALDSEDSFGLSNFMKSRACRKLVQNVTRLYSS